MKCEHCKLVGPGNWECENPDDHLKAQAEVSSADVEFDGGRQWYLNFGTSLGVSAQTPEQFNQTTFSRCPDFKAEAVRVIEYSAYEQNRAALSALQKEIDKLRETLSAMNSLATKYRNNCDMLMQYRGVFKDEIEKLLAENAILREGLRWISVGTAEPTRFALAVLSDADKVRA